jgi:hypothetical protein
MGEAAAVAFSHRSTFYYAAFFDTPAAMRSEPASYGSAGL